jgi:pimeloyl-ACP methyl ester carboxylesterase
MARTVDRQIIDYYVRGDMKPLKFVTKRAGQKVQISFEQGYANAILRDGTCQKVRTGGFSAIFDRYNPALTALGLASWWEHRKIKNSGFTGFVFIASEMAVVPYRLTPGRVKCNFRSSFDEVLGIERDGILDSLCIRKQGLRARRARGVARRDVFRKIARAEAAPSRRRVHAAAAPLISAEANIDVGGLIIRALITKPAPGRMWPAVLFFSGSGEIDRFGFAGDVDTGIRQFADGMTKHNFLAMTLDTPGSGDTKLGRNGLHRTFKTSVQESVRILDYLLCRDDVAADSVVIVGHSLGGLLALLTSIERPGKVRGVALLAAPGRAIEEVIEDQIAWRSERLGLPKDSKDAQIDDLRKFVEAIRNIEVWEPGNIPDHFLAMESEKLWMKDLIGLNPSRILEKLTCRIALFQGGRDIEISPQKDALQLLNAAYGAGISVQLHLYPHLDHLFMQAAPHAGMEVYSDATRQVAPEAITDLAAFVTAATSI